MKVYVIYYYPYHDNGEILGVFSTLENAKARMPDLRWEDEGWYVENHANVVSQARSTELTEDQGVVTDVDYLIQERTIDEK